MTTQAQRHESHANSWPTTNLRKEAGTTDDALTLVHQFK